MAEITYTGRGGGSSARGAAHGPRPSTASPRLEGASGGRASAGKMLSFLDAAEGAAARQQQPSMFPPSASLPSGVHPGGGGGGGSAQRQRPKSALRLRTTGAPRVRQERLDIPSPSPPPPRQYGRLSLYDHGEEELEPHEVPGPKVLRDLAKPRVGFPSRAPEGFMRSGEGLDLRQRNKLKAHLQRYPVNTRGSLRPGARSSGWVLNLFRSRGGALVVDMGYNKRAVRSCRELATTFMTDFEMAGGPTATAAVRRYSPGYDPAVTDASMARAAAKAAARAAERGGEAAVPSAFKPFTLF
ncbi:hypothetical protein TSOC_003887 [Tetrabaena socialis]|uniref:Uncharacterized protein n=1 Tax=Tetrabaena socialis TaxID=47790 RepID=A0A2J8AAG5_9CHLO|nr:hypothetical protein TSOC_003887 [Tetrabaena socialis]|eukprot:PNH09473.1 hypothetical protein TSOC_003887 [Tetrabaena socialis]